MAEYIDRDALMEKFAPLISASGEKILGKELMGYVSFRDKNIRAGFGRAVREVCDAPAADVAPVVHSRWLFADMSFNHELRIAVKCANCDTIFRTNLTLDETKDWKEANKFCKLCGAKMDEVTSDA